ncbi:MAG: WG repeat-containing protein, partial [Calothrix sp. MO_167.B42]|nr:WG repeat-containing protein [Calothrix sp. MO_167.B42]
MNKNLTVSILLAVTLMLLIFSKFEIGQSKTLPSSPQGIAQASNNSVFAVTPKFDEFWGFVEGLSVAKIGSKYGYINTDGTIGIEAKFDEADSFSEGLARIKIGSVYGFINKSGKIVISPQFKTVGSFSEG